MKPLQSIENIQIERPKILQNLKEKKEIIKNSIKKFSPLKNNIYIEPAYCTYFPIIYCEKHPKFQLNMICAENSCQSKGLICCRCLTQFHSSSNHSINSILCLDEIIELCLNKLDLENEHNNEYQNLLRIQKGMVDVLRNLAKEVYDIAEKLEQDIRISSFETKIQAQLKQQKIKEMAELLIYQVEDKEKKNQNNQNIPIHKELEKNKENLSICQINKEQQKQQIQGKQSEQELSFDKAKFQIVIKDICDFVVSPKNNEEKEQQTQKSLQIPELENYIEEKCMDYKIKQELLQIRVSSTLNSLQSIKFLAPVDKKQWECKIHQDLDLKVLMDHGWICGYDFPYAHSTTIDEIEEIKSQCFLNTLVLVGAIDTNKSANIIKLAGIDYGTEIFQQTNKNKQARKSQNGDIFWYFVPKKSFGFSPEESINLNEGDYGTHGDRLSWKLNGDGGYRVGEDIDLYKDSQYKKIILFLR